MTDVRLNAWQHLFPHETQFAVSGGPDSFRRSIGANGAGTDEQVLVAWAPDVSDLSRLSDYQGLVLVNSRGITTNRLHTMGFSSVRQLAVLPSLNDARWLIPLGSPVVTEKALKINKPFRVVPRLKHSAACMAARWGISSVFRDQIMVAQRGASPLEEALTTSLDIPSFDLAITTGTVSPTPKSTIAVLDDRGTQLAFVKIGSTRRARELIDHEARSLQQLKDHAGLASRVPELLFHLNVNGSSAAAQRVLPGKTVGSRLSAAHLRFLDLLGRGSQTFANETNFMHALNEQNRRLMIEGLDQDYALTLVQTVLEGVAVRRTIVHGDFAPWNLRLHQNQIHAFDWEYGELDGLPLIDEVYYGLQVGLMLRDWTEDEALDYLKAFQSVQADGVFRPHQVRALQIAGLLRILFYVLEAGAPADIPGFDLRVNLTRRLVELLQEELR